MSKNLLRYALYCTLCISVLSGPRACAPMLKQPLKVQEAKLGARSQVFDEMKELPEPLEPVVVAVYKFRDQTGQYKPSETGASWSTAVTQGATSILLESLEESGWFIPIEREGLSNLLNERKIIRSSRAAYSAENSTESELLPPLLFGGIIMEGGIISYESNVLTGGAGLRYFGAGGSGQYREDRVTIYLRAISTSNGRILKTVHTTKTILSQKIDAGLFRYVSLKRLLEAEAGFTYNEPAGIAVQEAIDKAVHAMIIEGILDDLWTVSNEEDFNSHVIQQYQAEKKENDLKDYLGFMSLPFRAGFKTGINGGMMIYDGDYPNGQVRPVGEFNIGFLQNSRLSLDVGIGAGQLAARDLYYSVVQYSRIGTRFRFFNQTQFTPFIQAGGGYLLSTGNDPFDYGTNFSSGSFGFAQGGLGYEYMLAERFGIEMSLDYHWLFNDNVDNVIQGKYNDFYWTIKLGGSFYFGK